MAPPTRTTDLADSGYYPSPHTAGYSPPLHAPAEEAQPTPHVVAPTPVNLFIQTNFTRVEHNYYYANQESDTSSGYGSTPSPTTASSTRSSFSFGSTDSPTSPYDQSQEHTVNRTSQSYLTTYGHYFTYPYRHQYDAVDGRCYQPSPLTEHGTAPYHSSSDGRVDPRGAYYTRGDQQYPDDCESTDRDCGYESEPESDGGWATRPVPMYGFYTTPNQAAEMWRHPSWFHSSVAKSTGGYTRSGGVADLNTDGLESAERATDCGMQNY